MCGILHTYTIATAADNGWRKLNCFYDCIFEPQGVLQPINLTDEHLSSNPSRESVLKKERDRLHCHPHAACMPLSQPLTRVLQPLSEGFCRTHK